MIGSHLYNSQSIHPSSARAGCRVDVMPDAAVMRNPH